MVQRIDLRIHAGAPSSRQDDDRYRTLADAYLGFTGSRQDLDVSNSPRLDAAVVPATVLRPRPTRQVDDSTTILAHADDTTFIEDTQLAYDALESQIFTSSLTTPEVTLVPRTSSDDNHDEGDISFWPEDLDVQSPQKPLGISPDLLADPRVGVDANTSVAAKIVDDAPGPSSLYGDEPQIVDQANNEDIQTMNYADKSVALPGLARKRRLIGNDFGVAITKPFRIPLNRTASETEALPAREVANFFASRAQSQQSDRTASSYLRTPLLDRSRKCPRTSPKDDMPAPPAVGLNIARRLFQVAQTAEGFSDDGSAAHGEQTRNIAHPGGNELGIAFIGELQQHTTPCRDVEQEGSHASGNGEDATSELPTTYSLTGSTTSKRTPLKPTSQRSTSDPGPSRWSEDVGSHPESNRSSSHPAEAAADPSLAKLAKSPSEQRSKEHVNHVNGHALAVSQNQTAAKVAQPPRRFEQDLTGSTVPSATQKDDTTLNMLAGMAHTIRPPHPPVSTDAFTTQITDSLAQLANDARLRYNPIHVAREVRPLERGYWLIRIKNVPAQLQLDSWHFLDKYIRSGKAGWGVWCTRIGSNDCSDPMGKPDVDVGDMKIFCWGEVVRHIYLLLYVASNSQVRKFGLQWIDAEGQVVVQMRSKA
ncbi:hypothetical protein Tdes44962_MAKER00659 [Teratosphaeria destructans]|uniref:Uncharacterized protein n=1 Tax=Teratosphaeria destructans TaxID=418781 RepID=A0A9W7W0X2_9PEZI|nr:hypothetical protein Tdes44962_MAKER00659 [Teratosphaeria destructans]